MSRPVLALSSSFGAIADQAAACGSHRARSEHFEDAPGLVALAEATWKGDDFGFALAHFPQITVEVSVRGGA